VIAPSAVLVALLFGQPGAAIPSEALTDASLPRGVTYRGELVVARQWKDRNGENVVVLSRTTAKTRDGVTRFLFGVHSRNVDGRWQAVWEMKDWVDRCDLDLVCEFVPASLEVTDLDGNGTAEVSFLYRLGCRGDISPDDQKLLLYQGAAKHALRGTVRVTYPRAVEIAPSGGDFKADAAFRKAPPSFLRFARDKWDRLGAERRE
jgi:hypothetical protein